MDDFRTWIYHLLRGDFVQAFHALATVRVFTKKSNHQE